MEDIPIVVGAGPVGLGAALFLTRHGRPVRVVEMRSEPSTESRALAVNPRTLDLLEPHGLTRRMLELGSRIHGVRFHKGNEIFATISLAGIHPRYPFMLALSQASTERLLEGALGSSGVRVERNVKMVVCRTLGDDVEAVLESTTGGTTEIVRCPWLLAADGARSTAREQLDVAFRGTTLDSEWYLADVPLETGLAEDHGHVFFFDSGAFLFMLRVIDEKLKDLGAPVWRLITNRPDPLSYLVGAKLAGPPVWESSFRVSHRTVAAMAAGSVYFAGDAAHLHSPIGARGMNLGLEDAWVFAELAKRDRLGEYDALRRRVDKAVVRRVEVLTRLVSAQSAFSRVMRERALPAATKTPLLRGRMLAALTGLDHELPESLVAGSELERRE